MRERSCSPDRLKSIVPVPTSVKYGGGPVCYEVGTFGLILKKRPQTLAVLVDHRNGSSPPWATQ